MENTIKMIVPLTETQKEKILSLRQWANIRAVAATKKEDMDAGTNAEGGEITQTSGGRALDV